MEPPSVTGKGKGKATDDDAFFMERLEMLYDQGLADLRAFAEREGRGYDEVRRVMAQLHCKWLFDRPAASPPPATRTDLVSQVLQLVSQQLESLESLAELQSFFLVVNPTQPQDQGFLGGTERGREFWRGHRGCGSTGVQLFKAHCLRSLSHNNPSCLAAAAVNTPAFPEPPTPFNLNHVQRKGTAREVKTELYGAMRDALRTVSGVRNAEMKWSNHSKLDALGVRLDGWPDSIPHQNPSTLSVPQNSHLLELLRSGKMFFTRLDGVKLPDATDKAGEDAPRQGEDAIFEDSIDYSNWLSNVENVLDTITDLPGEMLGLNGVGEDLLQDTPLLSGPPLDAGPSTHKKRRLDDT